VKVIHGKIQRAFDIAAITIGRRQFTASALGTLRSSLVWDDRFQRLYDLADACGTGNEFLPFAVENRPAELTEHFANLASNFLDRHACE
jgi:hypothetical protein